MKIKEAPHNLSTVNLSGFKHLPPQNFRIVTISNYTSSYIDINELLQLS